MESGPASDRRRKIQVVGAVHQPGAAKPSYEPGCTLRGRLTSRPGTTKSASYFINKIM